MANILHWELSGWTLCEMQKQKKKQSKVQQNLVLALIPYNEVTIKCIKEPFKAMCLQL